MNLKCTISGTDLRRVCRHLVEEAVEIPKRCLLDHECHHCAFDQWLEETGGMESRLPDMSVPDGEALAA